MLIQGLLPDGFLDGLHPVQRTAGWERVLGDGYGDTAVRLADLRNRTKR